MEKVIKKIIAESRYVCYPDSFPKVSIVESVKSENIDFLKKYIDNEKDQSLKGLAYAALGVVGDQTNQDQSGFILDQLQNEKSLTVEDALSYMTGCKVPINNRINVMQAFMDSKRTGIRHSAFAAACLCLTDWAEMEKELVKRFVASKNKMDQFWIAGSFSKKGTAACLPAIHFALENITDSDTLVNCLKTLDNIDAANQTSSLLHVFHKKKDTYVKMLVIKALIKDPDIEALEPVLERAKKILSKRTTSKDIDYQGGYSELQACFMFLNIFKDQDERVPEFFDWVKNKRMDYMDNPTQKWANENL